MKKTPKEISNNRQVIGREMETWHEGVRRARASRQHALVSPAEAEKQIAFCEQQLKECRKRMAALRGKGKKPWTF